MLIEDIVITSVFLFIVIVEDIILVSLWFPSPNTLTYTVTGVVASVLVGRVVLQFVWSVLYLIVPPEPPVTPIVCGFPSYVPEYAVNVGLTELVLFIVIVALLETVL